MPIDKIRGQKRTFQGESQAKPLLRALNGEMNSDAKAKNVVDTRSLRVLVSRLQRLGTSEYQSYALNRFLKRYVATPMVLPNYLGNPERKDDPEWQLIWSRNGDRNHPFTELRLVIIAIELAISGHIHALRQCPVCNRWIYGRFEQQKFCSAKCKDVCRRSDPAWQEERRKRAREYYWLHKNKNVR